MYTKVYKKKWSMLNWDLQHKYYPQEPCKLVKIQVYKEGVSSMLFLPQTQTSFQVSQKYLHQSEFKPQKSSEYNHNSCPHSNFTHLSLFGSEIKGAFFFFFWNWAGWLKPQGHGRARLSLSLKQRRFTHTFPYSSKDYPNSVVITVSERMICWLPVLKQY